MLIDHKVIVCKIATGIISTASRGTYVCKTKVITVGDKTTTGGTVENGALTVFCRSRLVALIGSESFCPQCKTLGVIRKTKPFNVFAENKQVCLENDVVECGCPIGTNRLIASLMPLSLLVMKTVRSVPPFSWRGIQFYSERGNSMFSTGRKNQNNTQVAKKQNSFTDTSEPEDNPLLNGVYIWTETKNAGHAFVSVHKSNLVYLFTYGRYGRTNQEGLRVMAFLTSCKMKTQGCTIVLNCMKWVLVSSA
jgi:uncharacterized Zn-binding protein involved in type VI secretion